MVDGIYQVVQSTTKRLLLQPGEKLITRLWSWTEERLQNAEDGYAKDVAEGTSPPYYSISTFAMALEPDETTEALIERLIAHVRTKRKAKYYCLATESELTGAGFRLIRSGPHEHHYDVPLG